MLLSAVSLLVVAQSSSKIPEGLMNNPVHILSQNITCHMYHTRTQEREVQYVKNGY